VGSPYAKCLAHWSLPEQSCLLMTAIKCRLLPPGTNCVQSNLTGPSPDQGMSLVRVELPSFAQSGVVDGIRSSAVTAKVSFVTGTVFPGWAIPLSECRDRLGRRSGTSQPRTESSRRRGYPRRPLTPPDMRFRIRRFMEHTEVVARYRAATPDPNDQSKTSGRLGSYGSRHCSTKAPVD